ncbi:MAG TPA: HigA family addiction module antitoxin [Edaphobacter sp.]|nr:HigA family addiction module antitoxin [Edaphobacter sp.]
MKSRQPIHPGKAIREFMGEDITVTALAEHLRMTRANLSRVLNGHASVTADLALKLSGAFNTSPELWINMQANYDLGQALQRQRIKVLPVRKAA